MKRNDHGEDDPRFWALRDWRNYVRIAGWPEVRRLQAGIHKSLWEAIRRQWERAKRDGFDPERFHIDELYIGCRKLTNNYRICLADPEVLDDPLTMQAIQLEIEEMERLNEKIRKALRPWRKQIGDTETWD
jgi:hypothetical protein